MKRYDEELILHTMYFCSIIIVEPFLTLFSLGGGGHIVPALTLTNNFITFKRLDQLSPNLVTFPKIYQRKISCVNDVFMMIDISIATVYSEVYFDYVLSFFSLFSVFSPLLV